MNPDMHFRFKAVWLSVIVLTISVFAHAQAPSGAGWTSKEVADGIQYYTFSGIDEVSGSAQQVFVIDLDLSNPRYALRFAYSPEAKVTSTVFKEKNAIVALNAAYEQPSVVIKVDGQMYSCMPADIVMDQPVPTGRARVQSTRTAFRASVSARRQRALTSPARGPSTPAARSPTSFPALRSLSTTTTLWENVLPILP